MKKEIYCLSCKKYTKNNNPKIVRNRQQVNDTIKLCKLR